MSKSPCLGKLGRAELPLCRFAQPSLAIVIPVLILLILSKKSVAQGQCQVASRQKHKIVNCLGPCAPRTRMRSISPVRLGPVISEIMLG